MIQIDTSNILFIVGGAFSGIEDIVKNRLGEKVIGFGQNASSKVDENQDILAQVIPEDLQKFGLIPEFIGRLPIIATLNPLDEEDLIRILSEPKNSLVKQYVRLMDLDDVTLEFEESALKAVAELAIERETGARGLRSIIENVMLDIMYEVPSRTDVKKVVITESTVKNGEKNYYDEDNRMVS